MPAKSPNVNCTPDLTRTPLKSAKKRTICLRTPSIELKAVWQNLLTRQIFIVNSTLGSQLNSPLESPDVMISHLHLNDVNLGAQSMGASTSKMCSIESFNVQQQQHHHHQQQQQNQQIQQQNQQQQQQTRCNQQVGFS